MVLDLVQTRCQLNFQSSRNNSGTNSATKSKLSNLLTVCLVTSSFLVPAQAAFGNSTKVQLRQEQTQHLVCVKEGQHLLCDFEPSKERAGKWASKQDAVENVEANESLKSSSAAVVPQLLTPAQQNLIANVLIWLAFALPCGAGLGILLYDKHCAYRADALRQQIERLERLWRTEV